MKPLVVPFRSMDSIREITIEEGERVILNVRSCRYIKLVFASCSVGVREEDGVVYTFTEQHPQASQLVDDFEVDPIAESCKSACFDIRDRGLSLLDLHNPEAELKAKEPCCVDLIDDLDNLIEEIEKIGHDSSDEYEKEDFPDSDDESSVLSELNYETDTSAALSYHYGDTQGDTQLDDYEETQQMD